MKKYILGVDGGGTKTELAVFDNTGQFQAFQKIGCTNPELLSGGYCELQDILEKALKDIVLSAEIDRSQIVFGVFGMAGVDTKRQEKEVSAVISKLGVSNFIVCNDAFLPIKAQCKLGYGIAAINGTGCTIAGIDPHGAFMQIGGMGQLTGDCGGGDYISGQLTAAVYNSIYKNGAPTRMTQLLLEHIQGCQIDDLFEKLSEYLHSGKLRFRDLNKIVFQAANENDWVAIEILKKVGKENACSIDGLIKRLNFTKQIDVVFAGSIYTKGENETILQTLKKELQAKNTGIEFHFLSLRVPPVVGAVLWAATRMSSGDIKINYREKVIKEFKDRLADNLSEKEEV